MSIKIEKDVPMPEVAARKNNKYPLVFMDVGDSFAFPPDRSFIKARAIVYNANKRYAPKQFRVVEMSDCVRCWRIA